MYEVDYSHLVGHADTDTLVRVNGGPPQDHGRYQRPVTPPQWRGKMGPPQGIGPNYHPGYPPVARDTRVQFTPGPDQPTEPQVRTPDDPLPPPLPQPIWVSDDTAHQLRMIRNLLAWILIILVAVIIASIVMGTTIAGDIQNLTSNGIPN